MRRAVVGLPYREVREALLKNNWVLGPVWPSLNPAARIEMWDRGEPILVLVRGDRAFAYKGAGARIGVMNLITRGYSLA